MIALLLMHSGSGRTIKNRNEFHTNKVNTDYYYVYSNLNIYQTFTQCFQGPRNHVFLNYRIHLSPLNGFDIPLVHAIKLCYSEEHKWLHFFTWNPRKTKNISSIMILHLLLLFFFMFLHLFNQYWKQRKHKIYPNFKGITYLKFVGGWCKKYSDRFQTQSPRHLNK